MIDKLLDCPMCKEKTSCYISPINEKYNAYSCFGCGYSSNDFMKQGEFDIEQFEETLPELYKDIKKTDEAGRYWYPQAINIIGKGTVFANGSSKDSWQWCAIKSVPLTEEEKEQPKFKNQTHKSDSKSLEYFGNDFIEALDYIGFFNV